ncbi:FKBP-type peptidyl-prolyl cis-trans isomerase [Serratia fonticola]|uniref:FKBP-type peptidyl-prolyl cis-trans isomerase n=1 Tax=Serratia fonticola TaxID=47917 RepID=UPI00217BD659|nr:FKBP-type peptidyl-prolyl cis-trans isomerase [Serratia fonticola]CAI1646816.1 FKBP-type peptidyl-prolyl cis-trans isomerase fkpA precursor [Serratia fonticola]CAI1708643.1 FKBP-type peptidyl-prolyl cis-trans isomerase fkpA precursor [Serratia fonticola]CAI1886319.1 FKBP-type peptidyl-prolyl cis-trans isomerase fkpA precursor [Serratia fonticola]
MRSLIRYSVIALFIISVSGGVAGATSSQGTQEKINTIKSLEEITSQIDAAPALLYLTPAQIDAASVESPQIIPKKNRNKLDKNSVAEARGKLHELKVQQATINHLKERIEQQNSELQALRAHDNAMLNSDVVEDNLKNALDDSQNKIKELEQRIIELDTVRENIGGEKIALQNALKISQSKYDKLQSEMTTLATVSNQKTQEIILLKKGENKKTFSLPENAIAYRDYSIGVSLGGSIISLLATREKQGISVDKKLVISGVEDAVFDQLKISPEKIEKALRETEKIINEGENKTESQAKILSDRYIKQFMKQPQSKKAPEGFYYRIDTPGKGELKETDTVTIVVKESLIDGKVIKDMNASGMAMSQRLDAYPPLFKAALKLMHNHGAMEIVVPSELAYGEKGLPPLIPPNSTVVYTIRILDVIPIRNN